MSDLQKAVDRIARLETKLEIAVAELAATSYRPEELEPFTPPGWSMLDVDPTPDVSWTWTSRNHGLSVVYFPAHGWWVMRGGANVACVDGPMSGMIVADSLSRGESARDQGRGDA